MLIDVALLPIILQDLVKLIGLADTMKLVEAYGGVRLYVPKEWMEDDHPLVKLLGRASAEKLQSVYGGEMHFDIPKAVTALRVVRDTQIRAKRTQASVRELALEYRLTERYIHMICGEVEDDRQAGLF